MVRDIYAWLYDGLGTFCVQKECMMNLKERLARMRKIDPRAIPLEVAIPEQMSCEELQARREVAARRYMRTLGKSDEEIIAYFSKSTHGDSNR
jgi:hypothetical protein